MTTIIYFLPNTSEIFTLLSHQVFLWSPKRNQSILKQKSTFSPLSCTFHIALDTIPLILKMRRQIVSAYISFLCQMIRFLSQIAQVHLFFLSLFVLHWRAEKTSVRRGWEYSTLRKKNIRPMSIYNSQVICFIRLQGDVLLTFFSSRKIPKEKKSSSSSRDLLWFGLCLALYVKMFFNTCFKAFQDVLWYVLCKVTEKLNGEK